MATGSANPLQKTHKIHFESRRICYPWHPWHGRDVLTRRAGGAHSESAYFCKLPEAAPHSLLVEIPKWMFDAAECAPMRVAGTPHVDCEALRNLSRTIAEQRISWNPAVLQPQVSRHTGNGDTDECDSKDKSTAGVFLRRTFPATLERPAGDDANRGDQTSGATALRHPDKRSSSRSSKEGRAR